MNRHLASPHFLALAGTVVLWASAFPAIRVGVDGFGLAALSFLRLAVAAVARLVIAPLAGVRSPRGRDLPLIRLCGLNGVTAYQVLLNWGEIHVEAGTASLLIAGAPVFSVLLAGVFQLTPTSTPTPTLKSRAGSGRTPPTCSPAPWAETGRDGTAPPR